MRRVNEGALGLLRINKERWLWGKGMLNQVEISRYETIIWRGLDSKGC